MAHRQPPPPRHQAPPAPPRSIALKLCLGVVVMLVLAVGLYFHFHNPEDSGDDDDSLAPPASTAQQVTSPSTRWLEESYSHPLTVSSYRVTAKPLLLTAQGERVEAEEVTVLVPYLSYQQGVKPEVSSPAARAFLTRHVEALSLNSKATYLYLPVRTSPDKASPVPTYLSALFLTCPVTPAVYQEARVGDQVEASLVAPCVAPVLQKLSHSSYPQVKALEPQWEATHLSPVVVNPKDSYRMVETTGPSLYLTMGSTSLRVLKASPLEQAIEGKQSDVYLHRSSLDGTA